MKTSITAMLSVRRGTQAVEFYKAAFGARTLFQFGDETSGVIAHMAIDDSDFWLADESPENQNSSPETLSGSTVRMVIIVDDPDALFDRAVAAGAKVVWPVEDRHYGWRIGRLVDPFGHHWEIGKPLTG